MTKTKKIWAVILSVAMIVTVFAISASAASIFDKAKKIDALDTVSAKGKEGLEYYYKIYLSDSGTITFQCTDYSDWGEKLTLMDSSGDVVIERDSFEYRIGKNYKITKKGTYYIRIQFTSAIPSWDSFTDFYYTFKPDNTPTMTIGVNMKVGDTLDLSAFASNYSGSVRWGTTKSKVATVNKGKVTAVAAGKAKIRAYMDNNEYTEIYVRVTKK